MKTCINIFIDHQKDDAGFFLIGEYSTFKNMLLAAAFSNEEFAMSLVDAALEYLDTQLKFFKDEEGGEA